MRQIEVLLKERSYPIFIEADGLRDLSAIKPLLSGYSRLLLVSNSTVFPLYGAAVLSALSDFPITAVQMPDGERYKTWDQAYSILDECVDLGLDRNSAILALGGGVVGDLSGFVAACYMRGIDFIQLPTTLLADVDSSVGGKVAVNHPHAKNTLGFFHQPKAVLIDPACLKTLPKREYCAGLAEVVKYGAICDAEFFAYLEAHADDLAAQNMDVLTYVIERSCAIKADVVARDEKETAGVRAFLNFGHTLGHALEAAGAYQTYLHGEAISLGMVWAAQLSQAKGWLGLEEVARIQQLLTRLGLPIQQTQFSLDDLLPHLQRDKKFSHGRMTFVLLKGLGQAVLCSDLEQKDLQALWV